MVNSSQSVNEGDGSVWICVDSGITGLVQTELVVTLSSIAGTASMLYIYNYNVNYSIQLLIFLGLIFL